jgi:DNA adenine methylase
VFFNLQKKQSFLSDINQELINTYQIVKDKPKELIKFLKTCKYEKNFFYEIRAWDREENWQKKYSEIERAGRFIFLNRTCFN